MINIRTIKKLLAKNGSGMTLKDGKPITYKTGWQVATCGTVTADPKIAMDTVKYFDGNCDLWVDDGKIYIDKSHRVSTKKEAMKIGKAYKQLSVYKWATAECVEVQ